MCEVNVACSIIWRRVRLKLIGKFLHKYLQGASLKYRRDAGVSRLVWDKSLFLSNHVGSAHPDPACPRGERLPEPLSLWFPQMLCRVVLFYEAN